ncbi:MAG: DUF2971 domain-containing protein, partial [Rickettsiales bacterium]
TLYKYVDAKAAEAIIESQKFRWGTPSHFKDPFDFNFNVMGKFNADNETKKFMREARTMVANPYFEEVEVHPVIKGLVMAIKREEESKRKTLYATLENNIRAKYRKLEDIAKNINWECGEFTRRIGIFCSSATHDNLAMWTHYADNHAGIVIKIKTFRNNAPNEFANVKPVKYKNTLPSVINHELLKLAVPNEEPVASKVYEDFVYTKSLDWAYEQEFRSIRKIDKEGFENVSFNPLAIDGVYLGANMNMQSRQNITKRLDKFLPHVEIVQCRRNQDEYKLDYITEKEGKAEALASELAEKESKKAAEEVVAASGFINPQGSGSGSGYGGKAGIINDGSGPKVVDAGAADISEMVRTDREWAEVGDDILNAKI